MKFISIEFKNLFAYGELVNRIDYDSTSKLILLKGKSGSGKSAILSAPILLLYGKLEKVEKNAVANRINKKGWMKGVVQKGQNIFTIERTFQPNSIQVWKNGENINSYGINDAQEYIDNEIVEIPQATFANMITISLKKFKSFLTMSPSEKKTITDRVFSLEIVNMVADDIKKDLKDLGSAIMADRNSIMSLNLTIQNANKELVECQKSIDKSGNQAKIDENNQLILSNNAKLQKLNDLYSQWNSKYTECFNINTSLVSQNSTNEFEISKVEQRIEFLNKDICPECGTLLSGPDFDRQRQEMEEKKKLLLENRNSIRSQILKNSDTQRQYADGLTKILTNISLLLSQNSQLAILNSNLTYELLNNKEYQGIKNIIDKTQEQIEDISKSLEQKNIEFKDLQALLLVYSLDGVKLQIINNYIPLLNEEVSQNLFLLEFPYKLTFDNKFNPTITHNGMNVPVSTLSDGEQARVDVVVLCSLFKLLKRRYPSINIFSADETISYLDPETSGYVLEFLKKFSQANNLNCFIVSHTDLYLDNFDEIIEVQKNMNGFSTMSKSSL